MSPLPVLCKEGMPMNRVGKMFLSTRLTNRKRKDDVPFLNVNLAASGECVAALKTLQKGRRDLED